MPENNLLRPVPVVRLIILDASGRALILRRAAGDTGGGYWCLPGGKIDYCDTVKQAAARELEEETGLRATGLSFLFYQDSLPLTPGAMHCINFYLECTVEGRLVLNEESVEAQWISREEMSRFSIAFRNDEGLARYWAGRGGR
ncbi:MAG: NUDIX domain-containing protein [Acidobacteria bacterium]|nr:NUDIX domain-containing protein [Acidobacteriota bacterium]